MPIEQHRQQQQQLNRPLAPRVLELLPRKTSSNYFASAGCVGSGSSTGQSTPIDIAVSPTVLLSPVLSRPVRSQSASSPFLRSVSTSGVAVAAGPPAVSDSESELTAVLLNKVGRSNSRMSFAAHGGPSNSSSPLATPPPTMMVSPLHFVQQGASQFSGSAFPGRNISRSSSFIRHPHLFHAHHHRHSGNFGGSFSPTTGSALIARPLSRQLAYCGAGGGLSRPGSLSIHDSFESSASGGTALSFHRLNNNSSSKRPISSIGSRPIQASLQRSHSDAIEHKISAINARSRIRQQHFETANSSGNHHNLLGVGGLMASSRVPTPLLNERHLCSFRGGSSKTIMMKQRAMRELGSEFSNASPDSASYPMTTRTAGTESGTFQSNLVRLRLFPLGHSDPQIYTLSQSPLGGGVFSRYLRAYGGRRNYGVSSTSPKAKIRNDSIISPLASRRPTLQRTDALVAAADASSSGSRKSPLPVRIRSSIGGGAGGGGPIQHNSSFHNYHHQHHPHPSSQSARPSISGGSVLFRQVPTKSSGANLAAPQHFENRRWSLASLPSSSGYGTPGSASAISSQYSSQENLAQLISDLRLNNRYDTNESYPYPHFDEFGLLSRPRSRSLTSPIRMFELGADQPLMSSVYKERFPKAKIQMENRLQQFLNNNAPLSGFTTTIQFSQGPPSPNNMLHSQRPTSPRPQSPLPRPISPLVTESATAVHGSVIRFCTQIPVNRPPLLQSGTGSTSDSAGTTLGPLNSGGPAFVYGGGTSSGGASGSGTPTQVLQQEPTILVNNAANQEQQTQHQSSSGDVAGTNAPAPVTIRRRSRIGSIVGQSLTIDPALLKIMSDGATRFLHHQLCEIAADCLQKSREDMLSCSYFCNLSIRLDETLAEAEVKVGADSYRFLARLVKQLLMVVARTARLLECLEFDPDEFYQLLEEAEGAVRYQLGSGTARVPDLPQYIISKLGLNKNLITEQTEGSPDEPEDEESETLEVPSISTASKDVVEGDAAYFDPAQIIKDAPKEEDFETIRLISNGAYGAVYLVKHKKTRQRYALKKMKKQTLILRNQVDQVFAERDILTFTDNPFVVSFYGSFETKQHLCMLMEYVEGGDCASLLKSAGTLPIELARLYVAETVLAIEYLHSCGIVHRDLKPDNLLITAMGHIKLTDFGLSKIGLMNRTTLVSEYMYETQQFKDNQLCGTPEYIAPEVILRQGYGKPVDWWALGIILYEFLVGIVPFMGESPEALFANIINEDVEYPEGDEALDSDGESLIRMLLEKNPVDRLGTIGGASAVMAHQFFASLDFDSILRQKAEFIPQLENDEDTSYFDSRTERYNHDTESADDESAAPMFWSFSTASPRHSVVGLDIPIAGLAALQAAHNAALAASANSGGEDEGVTGITGGGGSTTDHSLRRVSTATTATDEGVCSTASVTSNRSLSTTTTAMVKKDSLPPACDTIVMPSALLLRRRFSNQRQNQSTSSSGTGAFNTCSSTDSSIDASHFPPHHYEMDSRRSTGTAGVLSSPLPRFAISPCKDLVHPPSIGGSVGGTGAATGGHISDLSPVDEFEGGSERQKSQKLVGSQQQQLNKKRHSAAVVPQQASSQNESDVLQKEPPMRTVRSASYNKGVVPAGDSLRVLIPSQQTQQQQTHSPANSSPNQQQQQSSNNTYLYVSGLGAGSSSGQISPSGNSISSVSSFDSNNSPNLHILNPSSHNQHHPGTAAETGQVQARPPSSLLPPISSASGSGSTSPIPGACGAVIRTTGSRRPSMSHTSSSTAATTGSNSRLIVMRKGPQGFGFTIRSVRVYVSEVSEYYSIEHIVAAVREASPAYEAGLRENDLITHVHTQPVHNMTHPMLMHRLLSCGNELILHVVPLSSTSIKEGEARRTVGKLLHKKPSNKKSQQRRLQPEKKSRKASALLRRLSGKRGAGDILPGTKQTFMPRSVSSQEGALNTGPQYKPGQQYLTAGCSAGGEFLAGGKPGGNGGPRDKRLSIQMAELPQLASAGLVAASPPTSTASPKSPLVVSSVTSASISKKRASISTTESGEGSTIITAELPSSLAIGSRLGGVSAASTTTKRVLERSKAPSLIEEGSCCSSPSPSKTPSSSLPQQPSTPCSVKASGSTSSFVELPPPQQQQSTVTSSSSSNKQSTLQSIRNKMAQHTATLSSAFSNPFASSSQGSAPSANTHSSSSKGAGVSQSTLESKGKGSSGEIRVDNALPSSSPSAKPQPAQRSQREFLHQIKQKSVGSGEQQQFLEKEGSGTSAPVASNTRSPSPSRRISPSRLVQRFFRSSSSNNSSTEQQPPP